MTAGGPARSAEPMSTDAPILFVLYTAADGTTEFRREDEAVERARGRDGAKVVRVERTGGFEARQRVWPTVGPVYRKAG